MRVCARMCVNHILFVHSSVDGYLNRFHILAVVKNAAINNGVQTSGTVPAFISLGRMPQSGIPLYKRTCCLIVLKNVFEEYTIMHKRSAFGITNSNVREFHSLHILTSSCCLFVFNPPPRICFD